MLILCSKQWKADVFFLSVWTQSAFLVHTMDLLKWTVRSGFLHFSSSFCIVCDFVSKSKELHSVLYTKTATLQKEHCDWLSPGQSCPRSNSNVSRPWYNCSNVASAPNATTHGPYMTKWKMMWSSAPFHVSLTFEFHTAAISHLIARDQETVNFKAGAFSGANVTVDFHNYFFLITFSFTAKTFVIKLRLIPSAGLTIVNKEVLPYLFVCYCYTIV